MCVCVCVCVCGRGALVRCYLDVLEMCVSVCVYEYRCVYVVCWQR